MLDGKAGDSLVTNLLNGEQYPIGPKALADKYEHLEGDIFQTRMDKPVYIEADLPKGDKIVSREGVEKLKLTVFRQWKLLMRKENRILFREIIS